MRNDARPHKTTTDQTAQVGVDGGHHSREWTADRRRRSRCGSGWAPGW